MPQRRTVLPNRRPSETLRFEFSGRRFVATVGYADDGSVGELFLNSVKIGSGEDAIMRDAAILASFALQYGAPLDTLRKAMTRELSGLPSSPIGYMLDLMGGKDA